MLVENLTRSHTRGDHPKDRDDREAQTADAGLAIHLVGFEGDAVMYLCGHGRSLRVRLLMVPLWFPSGMPWHHTINGLTDRLICAFGSYRAT